MTEEINQAGDWITRKSAAQILNCSIRTIQRRIDTGKIETRIEYQGKQAIRYVKRSDILRESGTIQRHEPKEGITEVVTRGAPYDNPMTTIGQVQKVVTGLIWRAVLILSVIIILGGVTAYYLVIGQGEKNLDRIEGVKKSMSQGLSQVKRDYVTGNTATREALTAKIEEIRTDSQVTADKIRQQGDDITATGDQVKAQSAKIEEQTAEIKALREAMESYQGRNQYSDELVSESDTKGMKRRDRAASATGIEGIREEVTTPPPVPAATIIPIIQPIPTPEPESGFLGIF